MARGRLVFQVAAIYAVLVEAVGGFVTVLLSVVATLAGTLAAAANVGGYAITGAIFGLHVGVKIAGTFAGAQAVSKVGVGATLVHVIALLAVDFFVVLAALLAAGFGVFVGLVFFCFSSHEWKGKSVAKVYGNGQVLLKPSLGKLTWQDWRPASITT